MTGVLLNDVRAVCSRRIAINRSELSSLPGHRFEVSDWKVSPVLTRLIIIYSLTGLTSVAMADCNCKSKSHGSSARFAASPGLGFASSNGAAFAVPYASPHMVDNGFPAGMDYGSGTYFPGAAGSSMDYAQPAMPTLTPQPEAWNAPPPPGFAAAVPNRVSGPVSANQPPVGLMNPGVNRYEVSPPPGTLGRTYQQRSRIIEEDQHPRTARIEVHLPEDVDVSARGLKSTWDGKKWILETKEPLIPGLPHIYAVKAEKKNPKGEIVSTDVRWVRMIMGRIVELDF